MITVAASAVRTRGGPRLPSIAATLAGSWSRASAKSRLAAMRGADPDHRGVRLAAARVTAALEKPPLTCALRFQRLPSSVVDRRPGTAWRPPEPSRPAGARAVTSPDLARAGPHCSTSSNGVCPACISQPDPASCFYGPDSDQRPRPVAFVLPGLGRGRCRCRKLSGLESNGVSWTAWSLYDAWWGRVGFHKGG
jgi:hypothetical protein